MVDGSRTCHRPTNCRRTYDLQNAALHLRYPIMPHRLFQFVPLVIALRRCETLAFSSVPSCAKIRCSRHTCNPVHLRWDHALAAADYDDDDVSSTSTEHSPQSSHIVSIKSSNIAGMINDDGQDSTDIQVDFGPEACLVAVTGESGSGKSLLVAKAIDLITGGKAVSSLVPAETTGDGSEHGTSSVEMSE